MQVQGIKEVKKFLTKQAKQPQKQAVLVGYTANYALSVHENIEMKGRGKPRRNGKGNYWDPAGKGQAKFLEQPARENAKEYAELIREAYIKTRDLGQALLIGGFRLQRDSQELVPVDTSLLKNSAFTELEK